MKQDVAIQHDEAFGQMFARHPQRIQTARFGKLRILDKTDARVAFRANALSAKTHHDHDLAHVQTSKRIDLPVQKRRTADFNETLRLHRRAVEPCTFSCCEYDCFHDVWPSSFAEPPAT